MSTIHIRALNATMKHGTQKWTSCNFMQQWDSPKLKTKINQFDHFQSDTFLPWNGWCLYWKNTHYFYRANSGSIIYIYILYCHVWLPAVPSGNFVSQGQSQVCMEEYLAHHPLLLEPWSKHGIWFMDICGQPSHKRNPKSPFMDWRPSTNIHYGYTINLITRFSHELRDP